MEKNRVKFLFVLGTRPEAIKLITLFNLMSKQKGFIVKCCSTGQHKEMLDQVFDFFDIIPDYSLDLMKKGQKLPELTADLIKSIGNIIDEKFHPDYVIVQGDTTSAMVGALVAFYFQIKVLHVEAGLRTNNILAPFPEEANRNIISKIANYHFAPSDVAVRNLVKEGIHNDKIWNVGNTVVDSLKFVLKKIKAEGEEKYQNKFEYIDRSRSVILVTSHRRENFGIQLGRICEALKTIALENGDVQIVFPVHLNPLVKDLVYKELEDISNIFLLKPLNYHDLIWIMSISTLVITDSGGIQEEASTLGKPVLVTRETT